MRQSERAESRWPAPSPFVFRVYRPYTCSPAPGSPWRREESGKPTGANGPPQAYAGQEGGLGVADVLFGDFNPAARLPLTLYACTDQLPSITNYAIRGHDTEGIGRTYMYFDESTHGTVLYPFGHGLSYSTFGYDGLSVCQSTPKTLLVRLRVTNQSERGGKEVVQLYVRDTAPGVRRPLRALSGFRRVSLGAGESETVDFRIDFDELGFWDEAQQRLVVAPGDPTIQLGASSREIRLETTVGTDGEGFL